MEEKKKATAEETILGTMWRWPHSAKSFIGLKAAPYQVRNIPEKELVVILCQDGISGFEDGRDDDDEDMLERVRLDKLLGGDELQKLAGDLLDFRWNEVSLMDAIVESAAFAKGDFKGSLEAGFKSVDEKVVNFVKKMPKAMGSKVLDWSEPILWQAQFNTVVVIITPEEVYTAGCGCFRVQVISTDDVTSISSDANVTTTTLKSRLSAGLAPMELGELGRAMRDITISKTRKLTLEATFEKHDLLEGDECILVEQASPCSMTGGELWLQHGEDWGAAMTAISEDNWWGLHYEAIVLALKPPEEMSACRTEKVASPMFTSPTKMASFIRDSPVFSPSKMLTLQKRLRTGELLPVPPPLVTV